MLILHSGTHLKTKALFSLVYNFNQKQQLLYGTWLRNTLGLTTIFMARIFINDKIWSSIAITYLHMERGTDIDSVSVLQK